MSIHDGSKRVWLIIGCSTGLGRKHASLSLPRGHWVVATAPDVSRLAISSPIAPRRHALALDVTNSA